MTKSYYANEEATKNSKLISETGLWHRMGDLGYLDDLGRIWFCGRKVHALEWDDQWYYSICVEGPFNQIEGVKRTALVQDVEGRPSLCFEMNKLDFESQRFKEKVGALCHTLNLNKVIKRIYYCQAFPVDGRHNIKIDRKLLSLWIQEKKLMMFWLLEEGGF